MGVCFVHSEHLLCVYANAILILGGDYMPIKYKLDILDALKQAGYSTYRLRKEKILGERVIQQLRDGELVSWKTIETICGILNCQPGDIVEYQGGAL